MVNGREKFFENIGCFDLQAAGVDAWMAAERFVLLDIGVDQKFYMTFRIVHKSHHTDGTGSQL